jgi:low density lipoprotein receptor-related protein 5/6
MRSTPVAIALDPTSGKMWWTDVTTNTIERALSTPPYTADPPVLSGLRSPLGIALDPAGGKFYFVEESARKISRANLLDGSAVEPLVSSGLGDPRYIVLDGVGRMYWSDAGADNISRANTDGSDPRTLVPGQIGPYGLALDRRNRVLYWADNSLGTIQSATATGGVQPPFITGIPAGGIALDLARGKIYWAANGAGKIQRSNLDGTNIEDLITGLVSPHGIALR